ncbi:MAG: glycosyltransferase family 8 protein [Rickettsiales bacterium]|jgi:lipopolysaccharide biosynthesis glycosyltransferase|nr:glycosyltransferase family 8 protein [Rickettsiales bacterium]
MIPVFLASNDNYAPFVATTIASICYNTKSFVNFYVLESNISEFHKRQIESLRDKFNNFSIEFLRVRPELFSNFSFHLSHISLDMYSRFFMFELKPDIKKSIYIDVDVVVLGDIADLYNTDLENYPLGAIHDLLPKNRKFKYLHDVMKIAREHMYFNSGVLLFDNTKISKNFSKEIFEMLVKYREHVRFGDQDTLNLYFNKNYKVLDIKYNYMNKHVRNKMPCENVIIRHFEGSKKPWHSDRWYHGDKMECFKDWWFFAEMTPFYAGLQADFIASKVEDKIKNKKILKKIFNFFSNKK